MLRFAFWNLCRNPAIAPLVAELARSRDVDILVLAACAISEDAILTVLNAGDGAAGTFSRAITANPTPPIELYVRGHIATMLPVRSAGHWIIREATLENGVRFLLAGVHLISKREFSEDSQAEELGVLAEDIRRTEEVRGHENTLLIGDLNVNPFERGVISARGLHAAPSRNLVIAGRRRVQNTDYPYFYNPMWRP